MMQERGSIRPELEARRAATQRANNILQRIWKAKGVRLWKKMQLFRTLVIPVATYGIETWTMTNADTKYATATIMKAIRQASSQQGTKRGDGEWKPGATNATLRRYARIPHPATMFKMMRLRHLGATIRCEGAPMLRKVMRPRAPKSNTRGASSMTWQRQAEADMKDANLSTGDAHDMRKWKAAIYNLTQPADSTDSDTTRSLDEHSEGPSQDEDDEPKDRP